MDFNFWHFAAGYLVTGMILGFIADIDKSRTDFWMGQLGGLFVCFVVGMAFKLWTF